MHSPTDKSPIEADALARLPDRAIAYDLIYTPSPTCLLQLAAAWDLQTSGEVEVLVQQGGRLDWRFGYRSQPCDRR
jgi:shikimate dehydrogenase